MWIRIGFAVLFQAGLRKILELQKTPLRKIGVLVTLFIVCIVYYKYMSRLDSLKMFSSFVGLWVVDKVLELGCDFMCVRLSGNQLEMMSICSTPTAPSIHFH